MKRPQNHFHRYALFLMLLSLILFLVSCGSGEEGEDPSGKNGTDGDAYADGPPGEDEAEQVEPRVITFDDLAVQAVEPVLVNKVIRKPGDRYGSFTFVFRMLGTPGLAGLNRDELLFAFVPFNRLPEIDLVQNADGLILGVQGIIYRTAWKTEMPVSYLELQRFNPYYEEFMAAHETGLRRQEAVEEFRAALQQAHEGYGADIKAANDALFMIEIDNIVVEEAHYDVANKILRMPLDGYSSGNTVLRRLVAQVNGSDWCTGSASSSAAVASWAKSVVNMGSFRKLEIPMTIEEVEALIAATAETPGTMQVLVRNAGLAQQRCGTTNRTTMSVAILDMRLKASTESGDLVYDMIGVHTE